MQLKTGDPCVFLWDGKWRRGGEIVTVYSELSGVVRVRHGGIEHMLKPAEVRSIFEHDEALAQAARAKSIETYSDLVQAWLAGKRTAKALAEATGTSLRGIAARIRGARRRNLLPS